MLILTLWGSLSTAFATDEINQNSGSLGEHTTGQREKAFSELESIKIGYVDKNIGWYKDHVQWNRWPFYILNVFIILGGISLPLLVKYEPHFKEHLIVGVSLAVAASGALNGFFGLQENWHGYRSAQFNLEFLVSRWQVDMAEARRIDDENVSIGQAAEATRRLLDDAHVVISGETAAYFERLQPASAAGTSGTIGPED